MMVIPGRPVQGDVEMKELTNYRIFLLSDHSQLLSFIFLRQVQHLCGFLRHLEGHSEADRETDCDM